ncbi:hypothetical protein [Lelliottia amnigena]|uniref:hypothetical protein n=1 Tax=Lelliottia amnigena TaxID=61646 RepID=UPI002B2302B1|nr:hypothetical protein [Lelliottia amnigena]MEA9395727.1 hypothetical protein [Lelliottia amnigena]
MRHHIFHLKHISGILLTAGVLCLPLTSQANFSDFTTFKLVGQKDALTQGGQKICTYEDIINHTRVELTIPYICWPMAFQNRMDGQFYEHIY